LAIAPGALGKGGGVPGGQLLGRAFPGRQQPPIQRQERRVQPPGASRAGRAGWQAQAVAPPGSAQRPIRHAQLLAGLDDPDLSRPLPSLLGRLAVLVEAGALGAALKHLGLGQAVVVERSAQRLLAHPELASGPVNAHLVGQGQGLLGSVPVLQEPGLLSHRGPAAQPHPVAGGGAGEDAAVVLVGLGAVQGRL
jgi:hypothetical protein